MIWALVLSSLVCFAAPAAVTTAPKISVYKFTQAKEIWSLDYSGEKPVAAFFDASSGAIYVSVKDSNGRGRLDRVSLDGKLEKRGMATSPGEPGPMRAFDGKIYWVAGNSVQIVDPKGARSSVAGVPEEGPSITDIAVERDGSVLLLAGNLIRVSGGKHSAILTRKNLSAIFLLVDRLYFMDAKDIFSVELKGNSSLDDLVAKEEQLCFGCRSLERASSGKWLTTQNGKVLEGGKPILTLKTESIGHPAYVFRMDTSEDFFVLPLSDEQKLVAYRMPVTAKPKKTDQ